MRRLMPEGKFLTHPGWAMVFAVLVSLPLVFAIRLLSYLPFANTVESFTMWFASFYALLYMGVMWRAVYKNRHYKQQCKVEKWAEAQED